ncbi:MAG: hypothetical protein KKD05_08930 [Candidatus Omnitrophica bacterium]|nr:hypothetical protein [Candidatus Omnitrophota bacterium]
MYSFVFNSKKIKFSLMIFMLISFMLGKTLCLAETEISAQTIKDRFTAFVSQEDFTGLRLYLKQLKIPGADSANSFLVEYYTALADSMYLDNLEKKELWQVFYDNIDALDEQITQIAAKYADRQISSELLDLQYLAQKAYLRDEDEESAEQVFNNFVNNLIAYTEQSGDIAKFQEVARIIAQEGRKHQLNQLFVAYKDYLLANNADASSAQNLLEIADRYLADGQIDMAIVIYGHYIDFILAKYAQPEAKAALLNICDKFRDYGFSLAVDADFAEQLYAKAEKTFGPEVFNETEIFARGLNLEALGDYKRAREEYKNCAKKANEKQLLAEVYTRLGIINIFYQGNLDPGLNYLEKVSNEFADSDYADFCAYQSGLIFQWKKENQKAARIYSKLIDQANPFSAQAAQRKQEIDDEKPLPEELAYPLDMLFGGQGSNIVMTLKSLPQSGFINQEIVWQATAQDFSVGTVQPLFKYEWFGDIGLNNVPGNVTEFKTTYDTLMPKLLCLVAKTPGSENAVCRSVWIHDIVLDISRENKIGQPVNFGARIYPATILEKDIQWSWDIKAPQPINGQTKNFNHLFEQAGDYAGELLITIKGQKISKKFSFKVSE